MRGTSLFLVFLVITDMCIKRKVTMNWHSQMYCISMFAPCKNQISACKISEVINRFASIIKMTVY